MKANGKVFGLTGNIATGKSTVAWMFEELGVPIIYADEIAHEAIAPSGTAWQPIFERYGKTILLKDDVIDKNELAKIIFDDANERKFVESLIHPYVRSEIAKRAGRLVKNSHPFVIVEVPLLYEAGWEDDFDAVIVVRCNHDQELKRCKEKFDISLDEAKKRLAAQFPLSRKTDAADFIIDNDSDLEETKVQVRRLHQDMVRGTFPKP